MRCASAAAAGSVRTVAFAVCGEAGSLLGIKNSCPTSLCCLPLGRLHHDDPCLQIPAILLSSFILSLEATDTPPRARSISVRPHAVGRHPDKASMSRGGLIKEGGCAVFAHLLFPPQLEQKRQNPKHADRRAASFIPYLPCTLFVLRLDPLALAFAIWERRLRPAFFVAVAVIARVGVLMGVAEEAVSYGERKETVVYINHKEGGAGVSCSRCVR